MNAAPILQAVNEIAGLIRDLFLKATIFEVAIRILVHSRRSLESLFHVVNLKPFRRDPNRAHRARCSP